MRLMGQFVEGRKNDAGLPRAVTLCTIEGLIFFRW